MALGSRIVPTWLGGRAGGAPTGALDGAARPRLDALTGLRFFAALSVYLTHLLKPPDLDPHLQNVLSAGTLGVTFFFVLSGFVLAYTYFDRLRSPSLRAIWSYAVARFARVYPLYILLLVGVFAYWNWSLPEWWLLHVLMLQAWHPDVTVAFGLNGPAWSISVELFLYACFPLLVPMVARCDRSIRTLAIAGVVVALLVWTVATAFMLVGKVEVPSTDPWSAHRWLYRGPAGRLGDLLFGMILARLYLRLDGRPGVARIAAIGAVLLVVLTFVNAMFRPSILAAYRLDLSFMLLGGLLILCLALAPRGPVARVLGWAPIVLLGDASYALYLVHEYGMVMLGSGTWSKTGALGGLAWELWVLAALVGVSILLHFAFERPMRGLLRNLLGGDRLARGWRALRGARIGYERAH